MMDLSIGQLQSPKILTILLILANNHIESWMGAEAKEINVLVLLPSEI